MLNTRTIKNSNNENNNDEEQCKTAISIPNTNHEKNFENISRNINEHQFAKEDYLFNITNLRMQKPNDDSFKFFFNLFLKKYQYHCDTNDALSNDISSMFFSYYYQVFVSLEIE